MMPSRKIAGSIGRVCALVAVVLSASVAISQEKPREAIGAVLGETVYRDQLPNGDAELAEALRVRFFGPLRDAYRAERTDAVEPSENELAFAEAYFRAEHEKRLATDGTTLRTELQKIEAQLGEPGLSADVRKKLESRKVSLEARLAPPDRLFAKFVLAPWKFERHVYDKFGGGRVLWQQAGTEAFDADHQWLKEQEKAGKFRIDDPKLREQLYAYWTTQKHGSFLTDDKARIREFLNPPWVQASTSRPATAPRDGG